MWTYIAALMGSSAILLGAFGAHGLQGKVSPERIANWHTAANYHLMHAVALLALALFAKATGRPITVPATLFSVGIVFFSGSIYLLVLTGQKWLGPITPLGGLCMAAGWSHYSGLHEVASFSVCQRTPRTSPRVRKGCASRIQWPADAQLFSSIVS